MNASESYYPHLLLDLFDIGTDWFLRDVLLECLSLIGKANCYHEYYSIAPHNNMNPWAHNGCSATIVVPGVHIAFHSFDTQHGINAMIDIFIMNGDPHVLIPYLKETFKPKTILLNHHLRGDIQSRKPK